MKMRKAGGLIAVAIATVLVYCNAEPHSEQDNIDHMSSDRYEANGHKTRNLDPLGGGHLIRGVRETRHVAGLLPLLAPRHLNYGSPYGKREWPASADLSAYYDMQKRNFDEIDRSDLNPFIGKRNFDEIDQTSMPFPYATKRFYHIYGSNYLDSPIELYRSNFDKKRLRPEYPMDEIDVSHFPIGSKRSLDNNIDDYDRASNKKRRGADYPMDEIDVSHFPIGSRRSLTRR